MEVEFIALELERSRSKTAKRPTSGYVVVGETAYSYFLSV